MNVTSSLITSQVPSYIREESPKFVAFMQAYYDWMSMSQITVKDVSLFEKENVIVGIESGAIGIVKGYNETTSLLYVETVSDHHFKLQEEVALAENEEIKTEITKYLLNPLLASENFLNITDVDNTIDIFLESFYKEIAIDFPRNTKLTDTKVLKNIKNFYESKGTLDSYRFLFRIIYEEEIEFFYPREFILKPSDNDFKEKFIIKTNKNAFSLVGFEIKGLSSLSTATVEEVLETNVKGSIFYNILLNKYSLRGNFVPGEYFKINDETYTQLYEVLPNDNLSILSYGNNFTVDEDITIRQLNKKIEISVLAVATGRIDSIYVEDGGQDYKTGDKVVVKEILLDGFSHKSNFKQADAFISKVDENGSILEVQIISAGQSYQFLHLTESVEITTEQGTGAILIPIGKDVGRIKRYKAKRIVDENGVPSNIYNSIFSSLSFYDKEKQTNSLQNFLKPVRFSLIKSALSIDYPYFDNTKSFLSSNQKIQDSEYYQDFSYVIVSNIPVVEYKDIIKKLVHSSGSKLFGRIEINTGFQAAFGVSSVIGGAEQEFEEFIEEYRKTILDIVLELSCNVRRFHNVSVEQYKNVPVYVFCQNAGIKVDTERDTKQETVHKMPLLQAKYIAPDPNNVNYRYPFVRRDADNVPITDLSETPVTTKPSDSYVASIDNYDVNFIRQPIINRKTISSFISEHTHVVDGVKVRPTIDYLYQEVYPRNVRKKLDNMYDSIIVQSEIKTTVGFAEMSSTINTMNSLSLSMDNESLVSIDGFYRRSFTMDSNAGDIYCCQENSMMDTTTDTEYQTMDNGGDNHIDSEITMDTSHLEIIV